jgi:hypothetical protein
MARERGFTGHMLKPLDPQVLEKKLADLRHSPDHWSKP